MSKKSNTIPWSDEELILLKLNYACKGAKTWREISQNMQEYTGIIRTTLSLMNKIQKLKDAGEPMTIKDTFKLYNSVVYDVEHKYTQKFIDYLIHNFSLHLSPDVREDEQDKEITEILNIEPMSQIEKNRVDHLDSVDFEVDCYEEDRYVDEDEYKTKWNLGLILDYLLCAAAAIVILYTLVTYIG